jgi:oxygen-independent coproporphyrinogen-3 oxidase
MSQGRKGIGLYIHIPFCTQKCHYCDFSSYPGMESLWEDYAKAIVSELALKSELLQDKIIETIFIGGGTPSLIPYHLISMIMDGIRGYLLASDAEISIECNPGTLDARSLKPMPRLVSIGLALGFRPIRRTS